MDKDKADKIEAVDNDGKSESITPTITGKPAMLIKDWAESFHVTEGFIIERLTMMAAGQSAGLMDVYQDASIAMIPALCTDVDGNLTPSTPMEVFDSVRKSVIERASVMEDQMISQLMPEGLRS